LLSIYFQIQNHRELPDSRLLVSPRKSRQKEGDPNPPPLRGLLRRSPAQAAAELALRAATWLAFFASLSRLAMQSFLVKIP